MSLLDNQTFKKQIKLVKKDNSKEHLIYNIMIHSNHEINKSMLKEIEEKVNFILLQNYEEFKKDIKKKKDKKDDIFYKAR